MKKMKAFYVVIILLLAIATLIYFSRYIGYKSVYKSYPFISDLKSSANYSIKKISNKKLYYQFGDKFATKTERSQYYKKEQPKERIDGYLYYDTLKNNFWIETTERLNRNDGHLSFDFEEWVNIDLQGNTIEIKPKDSIITQPGMIVMDEVKNFYNWEDKSSKFYIDYFFKENVNWNSFMPFKGIGSLNGGSSHTWEGVSYFNLLMKENQIHFKMNAPNFSSYEISLYRLPEEYSKNEIVLLYIHDKFFAQKDRGLYLITKNSIL